MANPIMDWKKRKLVWKKDVEFLLCMVNCIEIVELEVYAEDVMLLSTAAFYLYVRLNPSS